ncbi:lactonase family protein [Pendulispora brunnea]|uniref:Lactonase family protein n=1 Tax=Pendulispora brunnea TaxID=2905690 RepID=A0ABZ2K7G2_9BACT
MGSSSMAVLLGAMGLVGGVVPAAFMACSSNSDNGFEGAFPDASVDGLSNDAATTDQDARAPLGPPRVYVGSNDGKIRTYSFNEGTYALTLIDTVDAGRNPSFLAFDSERRYAYSVADQQGQIRAFSIDRSTGKLTPFQTIDSRGAGPTYIGLDRAGKLAMVANYGGGTIAVFPRLEQGKLGESSATRSFGDTAQTHQIAVDPTNNFVYVPNKGLDRVAILRRNGNDLADAGSAPSGDGPRHIDFAPSGHYAYVIDENGSTVSAFTLDSANGALAQLERVSSLEPGYDGGTNTGAEIQVLPDGKHLIVSNRGDNSLMVFDIDASSGKLTRRGRVSTQGRRPRHFQVEPTGRFLFVGNEGSDSVVVMAIDPSTGVPRPVGTPLSVPSPSYVGLIYLQVPRID